MKGLLVLVIVLLALTSGCAGGVPKGFNGAVALYSGSVPPPYSWSRSAKVAGRQVTITETGKDARPERTRTLTDDDLRRVDKLLRGFPRDHAEDEGKVGGGYAVAEQVFAVLAGE